MPWTDADIRESSKATFAKLIRVTDKGLEIDGQEFPWYISEDGVSTQVQRNALPSVTVTIVAERVEVAHGLPGGEAN